MGAFEQWIIEGLLAMADERERMLMEMEELRGIEKQIQKIAEKQKIAKRRRRRERISRLALPAGVILLAVATAIVVIIEKV